MSTESIDPRQLTPETFDAAIAKWTEMDPGMDPRHPLFPRYQELSSGAKATYERLKLNLSMPGGLGTIEPIILKLNEMYDEALKIRGQMGADRNRSMLGVRTSGEFENKVDGIVDEALKGIDGGRQESIRSRLMPMLYGLGVNPSELADGAVESNFYFFPDSGAINFDRVSEAETMVKELRDAAEVSPGLHRIADMLDAGVKQIRMIEPGRAAAYDYRQQLRANRAIDTRPLRILGAVGGGLITVFGLAQFAIQKARGKNVEFSPLILGWAAATMAMVNPKIFMQSGTSKVLEEIRDLGQPEMRKVIGGGFRDPAALAELQELRGEHAKLISDLSGQRSLNMTQIASLTGKEDSPLTRTMAGMPETLRPVALRLLGTTEFDEGKMEIFQTYLKTPELYS